MSRRSVLLLTLIPVALLILMIAAGYAVESWLETSGGKSVVESRLSAAIDKQVSLGEQYDWDLWPSLHVSGSRLKVDSLDGQNAAQFDRYAVSIDLAAMLRGNIRVTAIQLEGGSAILDAWTAGADRQSRDHAGPPANIPDIRSLEVDGFDLFADKSQTEPLLSIGVLEVVNDGRGSLRVTSDLEVSPLAGTAFDLAADLNMYGADGNPGISVLLSHIRPRSDAANVGEIEGGVIHWRADGSIEASGLSWVHPDLGEADVKALVSAGREEGWAEFSYVPESVDEGEGVIGRIDFERRGSDWILPVISVDLLGQSISGHACRRTVPHAGLYGKFEAQNLDLDRLQHVFASGEGSGELPNLTWLHLELAVGTLHYANTIAEGVKLRIGAPATVFLVP